MSRMNNEEGLGMTEKEIVAELHKKIGVYQIGMASEIDKRERVIKEIGYHAYHCGFLAGFKAGKDMNAPPPTKWHDLRKDPTDVPKENVTVLLLTEVEPVTARYDNKYEAFFRLGDKLDYCVFIAPMSYIAWCEIPEYTKE